MANQWRMMIEQAAGDTFDRLRAGENLSEDALVSIDGTTHRVSVERPVHGPRQPLAAPPWDVGAPPQAVLPGGAEEPPRPAMGLKSAETVP